MKAESIQELIAELKQAPDRWDTCLRHPLSSEVLDAFITGSREHLKVNIPQEYIALLQLTDGVHTQRGEIYDAKGFFEQNYRLWFCEPEWENTPTGSALYFSPVERTQPPTYAWLGCNGNVDMYIYDYRSHQFAATTLGDEDEVWESFSSLCELLHYMTSES